MSCADMCNLAVLFGVSSRPASSSSLSVQEASPSTFDVFQGSLLHKAASNPFQLGRIGAAGS